jgi:hypothetical protein
MKITKTELRILEALTKEPFVSANWIYSKGPEGGWHNRGSRGYRAAERLIEKGLVSGRTYSTGAGRAALMWAKGTKEPRHLDVDFRDVGK